MQCELAAAFPVGWIIPAIDRDVVVTPGWPGAEEYASPPPGQLFCELDQFDSCDRRAGAVPQNFTPMVLAVDHTVSTWKWLLTGQPFHASMSRHLAVVATLPAWRLLAGPMLADFEMNREHPSSIAYRWF
ncbi:MAG: hypothetical protein KDB27_31670 [Planctomycetales bacterium]|nr:hypothetical protein [Planctomycetales bacterium]